MLISEFDYELPDELIAQEPLAKREDSRMLVLNRAEKISYGENFLKLPEFLKETDVIVLNNTKVFPARLLGERENGGNAELFLVKELENGVWETLARPLKRMKISTKIYFGERELSAQILEKTPEGRCIVRFETNGDFHEIVEKIGQTPLPPYIKRDAGALDKDRERYQTVFANQRGAIAAPTAGLHFTPEILEKIREKGTKIVEITLHVGYGTFEPVRVEDLSEHRVMPEMCEISEESAEILNEAKSQNSRVIAIGTTTTRALESSVDGNGKVQAGKRLADLTITPNYNFRVIDGILTNFHLPQSSLLVLVSTFGGHDFVMESYRKAVENRYRFYSYGDCMLII